MGSFSSMFSLISRSLPSNIVQSATAIYFRGEGGREGGREGGEGRIVFNVVRVILQLPPYHQSGYEGFTAHRNL